MSNETGDSHDIDAQKEFYDARWAAEQYAGRLKLRRSAVILELLGQIKIERPKILELGSGSGWLTSILGQFGPTTGVELSPAAIEEASKRYSHVEFAQVDLAHWDPAANTHDVVVSHEVLEHLENQDQHLQQAWKVLRPGGYLILTTPNYKTMHALERDRRDTWTTQPIENWVTRKKLRMLLRSCDFKIEQETTCILGHGNRGIRKVVNSFHVNKIMKNLGLDQHFDWLRKQWGFGLHLVVLAAKPK